MSGFCGFMGSVEHQLDDKNRIRIPKRFRDAFPDGDEIYFVKYTDGCIAVFPASVLSERLKDYSNIKSDDRDRQELKRSLFAAIEPCNEDGQGRILLSAGLRAYAHIKKDVITVGMYDYLEIWSPENYAETLGGVTLNKAFLQLPI